MPIATAGLPLKRASMSWFSAPSSTRATSLIRNSEPSGLARNTMLPNCSGVVSRPCVWMLSWNCCSFEIGRAPMRPTGAMTFCAWIAAITSDGVNCKLSRRFVSNQIRIE